MDVGVGHDIAPWDRSRVTVFPRIERVRDIDRADPVPQPIDEDQILQHGRVVGVHHRSNRRAGWDRLFQAVLDETVGHGVAETRGAS